MLTFLKQLPGETFYFVRNAEPVAAVHAFTALAALVIAVKAGHANVGLAIAAWQGVQAITIRKVVTPVPDVSNSALAKLVSRSKPTP